MPLPPPPPSYTVHPPIIQIFKNPRYFGLAGPPSNLSLISLIIYNLANLSSPDWFEICIRVYFRLYQCSKLQSKFEVCYINMIPAISLLAVISAVASAAGSADQCCIQRVKELNICIQLKFFNPFVFSTFNSLILQNS